MRAVWLVSLIVPLAGCLGPDFGREGRLSACQSDPEYCYVVPLEVNKVTVLPGHCWWGDDKRRGETCHILNITVTNHGVDRLSVAPIAWEARGVDGTWHDLATGRAGDNIVYDPPDVQYNTTATIEMGFTLEPGDRPLELLVFDWLGGYGETHVPPYAA